MIPLAAGLIGVSTAYLTCSLRLTRMAGTLWTMASAGAVTVFLIHPNPFPEVAIWAAITFAVCVLDGRDTHGAQLVYAGITGFLLGHTNPYLHQFLTEHAPAFTEGAPYVIVAVTLASGLALAGISGAAVALAACTLALGAIGTPVISGAIPSLCILAVVAGRARVALPALALLTLPSLDLIGQMT